MNAARCTILIGTAVLALTVGLTGCSGIPSSGAPATVAATASPAAAAVATGDVVDAVAAKALLKAGQGQRAYPMADGTFVVVTKTEPVPANVQADIEAKASVVVTAVNRDSSDDTNAVNHTLSALEGSIEVGTGKRVISVWGLFGYTDANGESKSNYWNVLGGPAPMGQQFSSRTEAEAFVNDWLAQQASANEYAAVYAG